MSHSIYSQEQQATVSEGDSTIVAYNYEAKKPHPLPDDLRTFLAALPEVPEGLLDTL